MKKTALFFIAFFSLSAWTNVYAANTWGEVFQELNAPATNSWEEVLQGLRQEAKSQKCKLKADQEAFFEYDESLNNRSALFDNHYKKCMSSK